MRPGSRAEGREHELARLGDVFAGVGESGLRLALVEGPPGAGKRRVLEAFRDRSRASGALVLEGRCVGGVPHAPFEAVVERALEQVEATGARGVARADLRCADGCHPLWFQHVGPLARRSGGSDVLLARRCLHGAIASLLEAVASVRPTVVALHDLEDADAESIELLSHLLDSTGALPTRPSRLMIAATLREGTRHLERLRSHPRAVRVRVDALDPEGLGVLLQTPEYLARLLASTGGLPRAIERLIESAPPTPDEHLARRLATLSAEARALFDALAVLGRPASADELAFVAGLPEGSRGAAELPASGLVRADAQSLVLDDADDAERTRAKLPPDWRLTLERRCIEHCLREPADPAGALRHAVRAGITDRALDLWEAASDALSARHADAMAADLLDRVAELAGAGAPVALHARLAELRLGTGEFRQALRAARHVLCAAPSEPSAARRVAQALVLAGDLPEAAQVVRRARRAAIDAGEVETTADLGATLAELLYQNGRLEEAERVALEVLGARPPLEAELGAMQTRAKVALAAGDLDAAERLYADYENRARATEQGRHEALAVGGRGVVLLTRGATREAERALRRCARLAEQAHDRKGQALACHNLAVAAHLAHDYAAARARYEEALRLLRLVGNRSSLARAAYNLGELYESLGDRTRARTMCELGAQAGGTGIAPRAQAEGLLLRGRVELGDGNVEQARAAFEAARELLGQVDPLRSAAAIVGLARAALHDGHVGEAAALLDEVPEGVTASRLAEVALARVALARARGADPVSAAREAVRAAEAASDEPACIEGLVALARGLAERGEHAESVEIADRAAALDARVGARVPEDLTAAWDDRPLRREMLALRAGRPSERSARAPAAVPNGVRSSRLVGDSAAIRRILAMVDRVGPSRCTVLLTGESGTGKELVAEALHRSSPRSDGPLVRVNCAALVESLLVSELFGHEKGAFTGAHERKKGRFELADGGTLFLDEIGDISPAVQAALLRVLQERRFERVGGRTSIEVDVRIVAATNRDLDAMVRDGTFREDLYYRLDEVRLEMPPLRDRRGDVAALAAHFLERVAEERVEPPKRLGPDALELLERQDWPGNVRQLENAIRAASLFADGPEVLPVHFEGCLGGASVGGRDAAVPPELDFGLDGDDPYERVKSGELSLRALKKELERRCVERALTECEGNISKAAGLLGMKRPRLSQLVKEYGLRTEREER